jgi:hypothetical protein
MPTLHAALNQPAYCPLPSSPNLDLLHVKPICGPPSSIVTHQSPCCLQLHTGLIPANSEHQHWQHTTSTNQALDFPCIRSTPCRHRDPIDSPWGSCATGSGPALILASDFTRSPPLPFRTVVPQYYTTTSILSHLPL